MRAAKGKDEEQTESWQIYYKKGGHKYEHELLTVQPTSTIKSATSSMVLFEVYKYLSAR
jgi:hypothetical protein